MGFRVSVAAVCLAVSASLPAWAAQARIAVLRDSGPLGDAGAQRLIRGFREVNLAVAPPAVVVRAVGAGPSAAWLQCLAADTPKADPACTDLPALPVDAVAAVFLDRLGTTARVVLALPGGSPLSVRVVRRRSQLAVLDAVEKLAAEAGQSLVVMLDADRAFRGRRDVGWGVVAAGGIAAGIGAILGGVAVSSYGTLTSPGGDGPRDVGHAMELQRTVSTNSVTAITLGAVAIVATGIGLSMVAAPFGSELTDLRIAPSPGGAVISGRFP